MHNNKMYDAFDRRGFSLGRCFGSKVCYFREHPDDFIIYNAVVMKCDNVDDEYWTGDLNLNEDMKDLMDIAGEVGPLSICRQNGEKILELYNI